MAALDDAQFEHQVATWAGALERAGAREADVLHLHHLTPINEAAHRVAPGVAVVGHLHGTELLMLEEIERGEHDWPHAARWAERMRAWVARCERVILLSESAEERAERLLGVEPGRCLVLANGFDRRRSGRGRSTAPPTGGATSSTSRRAGAPAGPQAASPTRPRLPPGSPRRPSS
jgi:hypothetical protein